MSQEALLRTLETLALSGASALTSAAIGTAVDSAFPKGVPEKDSALLASLVTQFGLSTWAASEIYSLLLSFRGSDLPPPPIGDGVPVFFLYYSQPNFRARFTALLSKMRGQMHNANPALSDV